jgi:hypothetical protein
MMNMTVLVLAMMAGMFTVLMSTTAAEGPTDKLPVMKTARIESDFELDGNLSKAIWQKAEAVCMDRSIRDGTARTDLSTTVRCLWSSQYLYFSYECPYTKLTVFNPPSPHKRNDLWAKDVVEAFIGPDLQKINHYAEFEVSPSNERLDLLIDLPEKDFKWDSQFQSAVKVDEKAKIWRAEFRIPLSVLSEEKPKAGTQWRINLFRNDRAAKAFLAWSPTLTNTTHTPERFGVLEFSE